MTGLTWTQPPPPPWDWEGTESGRGSEAWRRAWLDLGAWVQWYTGTFELWAALPVCWFEHPRLVAELVALRFYHRQVVTTANPDGTTPHAGAPTARDHWDWHFVRREWERAALGVDPRSHGGCTGPRHVPTPEATATGHAARLEAMRVALEVWLERHADDAVTEPGRAAAPVGADAASRSPLTDPRSCAGKEAP